MKAMRLFCAVVLLALGFGHQPVPASGLDGLETAIGARAAEYRLPDGSFAELCIAGKGGDPVHHSHALLPPCDVCLLCASLLLPAAGRTSWLKTQFAELGSAFAALADLSAGHGAGPPRSRGPPIAA